jgi:hypothetical protein
MEPEVAQKRLRVVRNLLTLVRSSQFAGNEESLAIGLELHEELARQEAELVAVCEPAEVAP